ncbi:MAG: TetR/AcrR family transcriptional regulator C-terminal domain-containing protein, partial [Halarsenatibacteraceae bacterium]
MADSLITKNALASVMKELMAEKPIKKINVKDITNKCGLSRKSFYYHFKDKYELVNWIFYTEFVKEIKENDIKYNWDLLENICNYFYKNKEFYAKAFEAEGQNSFSQYFVEVMRPIILKSYKNVFNDNEEKEFFAVFFADATRLAIKRWILEEESKPPEKFIELMKTAATGLAKRVISRLE